MDKRIKIIGVAAILAGIVTTLTGCKNEIKETSTNELKVAMITDSGSIDDKSFNQGTWEGIVKYSEDNPNAEIQYLKPNGETTQDYLEQLQRIQS